MECGQQGHLARDCTNRKTTQLLINVKQDGYGTAEEYTFITTARSYQEIEEMILDDIFSVEEGEPDPLDEILSSSDKTEDLYLPD